MTSRRLAFGLLMASGLALSGGLPARAQEKLPDLATYAGADRTEKLIAGAKKEGTLTLYTSLTVEDMNVIGAAFEKKYGVKVRTWRASNEDILQRAVVEKRGGRFEADVYETDGNGMEGLRREGLLQAIKSPAFADLMPQALKPEAWIGTRLNVIVPAYNTNLIKPDQLPRTFEDLADPKWKGKLGIEAADADWFATIVESMGEQKGLQLFRDIVSKNGMSVRKGHTLIANLVAAGEIPFALTTYIYKVNQLKAAGAPIAAHPLNPAVARVNGIGVAPNAPHPHAALLFMDFMLTDAQQILAQREFFPTNVKAQSAYKDLQLTFVDASEMLDKGDKWDKLYSEIVVKRLAK